MRLSAEAAIWTYNYYNYNYLQLIIPSLRACKSTNLSLVSGKMPILPFSRPNSRKKSENHYIVRKKVTLLSRHINIVGTLESTLDIFCRKTRWRALRYLRCHCLPGVLVFLVVLVTQSVLGDRPALGNPSFPQVQVNQLAPGKGQCHKGSVSA